MKRKGPVNPLCLLPLSAPRPPSGVLWALNPARTTRSVSSTTMSVMEKQTAEMALMRKTAYRRVKRVNW